MCCGATCCGLYQVCNNNICTTSSSNSTTSCAGTLSCGTTESTLGGITSNALFVAVLSVIGAAILVGIMYHFYTLWGKKAITGTPAAVEATIPDNVVVRQLGTGEEY